MEIRPNLGSMPTRQPPIEIESNVPRISTRFYVQDAINPELWDQYTPYQLVIVKASTGNDGETRYEPTRWRFTLPFPPQEMSKVMPFATTIQATITGVSIQHGGAPFRDISLMGTTGVNPGRNRGEALKRTGVVPAIFAGSISAANLTKSAIKKLDDSTYLNLNVSTGLSKAANDPNRILETSTGYYQMRLMEQFLESYIAIKTGAKSELEGLSIEDPRMLRLAFCQWKDEAVDLVEPLNFVKKRSASSPMEYTYQLRLQAYKRIHLNFGVQSGFEHQFVGRDPNAIAQIFNRFRAAREILTGLNDVLKSFVSDPANLLNESLREVGLFLGEVSGLRSTIDNYPEDVKKAFEGVVAANWTNLRSKFQVSPELDRTLSNGQVLDDIQRKEFQTSVLSKMTPDSVRVPSSIKSKIQSENQRVQGLTRSDFEKTRDLLIQTSADFADKVGVGSVRFNEIYNRNSDVADRTVTDSEMDVLYALNESVILMDHLAASSKIDPPQPSSLEYVAGLAEQSGIAFRVPRSKTAVPFPYGATLEQLALQYLGDPNRWHEIATLNGLRTPFVDEEGFSLNLIANGEGHTIVVDSAQNLFQGQTVWVESNSMRRSKRHIIRIETISASYYILTLDGDPDLGQLKTSQSAKLSAFLPGTVNSQQVIYVPSDVEVVDDPGTKAVPGVDAFDRLLSVGGVDLLLTADGDLAITPDGDCRLAYGLTNIVQTIKLALNTPKGSLIHHPEYGLALPVGTSTADVDPEELLKSAKELFANDSMFSGVRSASVVKEGSTLRLVLDVGIAGTSQFIPVSVTVR